MFLKNIDKNLIVSSVDVKDLRWPTSLGSHGSDAMHVDPDYSCAYVTVTTNSGIRGFGLTFTCGRGTEIVLLAVKTLRTILIGRPLCKDIYGRFGQFWRELTSESQLRWV